MGVPVRSKADLRSDTSPLKPHGGTDATTAAPDGTNRRVQPPRVCNAVVGLRAMAGARCGARGHGFARVNQAATVASADVDRSGSCGPGASGRRQPCDTRDSVLQGRYVLAFSMVVPLLAGEILVRRYERLRALDAHRLFLPFAATAGFVQFVAWWTNARRFAVGVDGPEWFLSSAEWSPPWGWTFWLTLAAAGGCLLLATARDGSVFFGARE